jgi:hypothetical protein
MNDLEVQNPYGKSEVVVPTGGVAMTTIESNRAVSEAQAMVIMAKRFPRDPVEATERILNEFQRTSLAEVSMYSYSRGGTEISGMSIRGAEAIARHYGNLDCGVKELSQADGKSEMMSYCVDLESNYRQVRVFSVSHVRHTKKGQYRLEDPRDIYEASMNQAARRLRAVILAVIPSDIIEAAMAQAEQTLKAKADTSPDALRKMVEAFAQFNVTKAQIEKRIQRKLESITAAQVISLRKIYNSLKDGMSSAGDWFSVEEFPIPDQPLKGAEAAKDALKRHRRTKAEMEAEKQQGLPLDPLGAGSSEAQEPPKASEDKGLIQCPIDDNEGRSPRYCLDMCQENADCPALKMWKNEGA